MISLEIIIRKIQLPEPAVIDSYEVVLLLKVGDIIFRPEKNESHIVDKIGEDYL